MTAPTCAICGRPTPDGWVDVHCGITKPTEQLRAIAELAPSARLVAAGLVRRGNGGAGSNKPGSRPPLNDGATDALGAITNTLTTIAREIAETRGLQAPRDGHALADPLAVVCSWLSDQLEWLRHASDDQGGPYALGVLDEIGRCASRMRWLVDGPAPQRYLGPCGTEIDATGYCDCRCHTGPYAACDQPGGCGTTGAAHRTTCEGDVYARDGASTGRCKTCGAEWSRAERTAWLDGEVRGWAYRAAEIEDAYRINANTIRSWAARGHLVPHGHDQHGRPLFNLGDVLDLAAADAARRETERAKRERRAAERAEESEDAA